MKNKEQKLIEEKNARFRYNTFTLQELNDYEEICLRHKPGDFSTLSLKVMKLYFIALLGSLIFISFIPALFSVSLKVLQDAFLAIVAYTTTIIMAKLVVSIPFSIIADIRYKRWKIKLLNDK